MGWKSFTACFTRILWNHDGVTDYLISEHAQATAATQMFV